MFEGNLDAGCHEVGFLELRTPSMTQVDHTKTIRQFVMVSDLHVVEHCPGEQSSRGSSENLLN